MLKRLLSSLLVFALLVSSFGIIGITAAEEISIKANESVVITNDDENIFKFIPEEDGFYEFASDAVALDPYGRIEDEHGEIIVSNDDCDIGNYNFRLSCEMKKGTVYYLYSDVFDDSDEVIYTVILRKSPLATEIELVPVISSGNYVGDYVAFVYKCLPEGSVCPNVSWHVEDENVAIVDGSDSVACAVVLIGAGKTNLVLTSKYGVSAKYEIECFLPPEIKLQEKETISIEDIEGAKFSFIPEKSGAYYFQSSFLSYLDIKNSKGELVARNDSFDDNLAFSYVKAYLEKGEVYILSSSAVYGDESEYTVFIDECVSPESVQITANFDTDAMFLGASYTLIADFSPYNSFCNECTWSVSDESIVTLTPFQNECDVSFTGVGSVEVTVAADELEASVDISSVDMEEIELDEEKTIIVEDKSEYSVDGTYLFVPEKSGYYVFMSDGNVDTVGMVWYDSVDNPYGHSDDYNSIGGDYDFAVQLYLEEGEAYVLQSASYGGNGSYTVKITEAKTAESVHIDTYEGFLEGVEFFVGVYYDSKDSLYEDYTVHTDCEGAWEVHNTNNGGFNIVFDEAGAYNIWIETDGGLVSEKISVQVRELAFTPIELNKEAFITMPDGDFLLYEFTPDESGTYCIYSDCEEGDPRVDLINENMENLDSDDDGGYGLNFRLLVDMEAGETYRFKVGSYDWEELENISFGLGVTDDMSAESISFGNEDTVYACVDEYISVSFKTEPIYAIESISELRIENEEVVELVESYDDSFEFYALSEGEATITIVTENGFTASIKIVVYSDAPEEPLYGDANGDGQVNAMDSNVMKRYLTGVTDNINLVNADMNGDSSVDAIDANILQRTIAGM